MNVFIASNEIASATHLQIRIMLQMNVVTASEERATFVLGMNTFGVVFEDERVLRRRRTL